MERILPQYDAELTRPVVRRLGELGVEIMTSAKAKGLASKQGALVVEKADGKEARIAADKVLVTVGRRPVTEGWGREELVLDMDGRFDPHRRSVPDLDARHLRHRRRDRRADAGASCDGAGRDGGRDRGGPPPRLGQEVHSRRVLHRSGDRHGGPVAGGGPRCRAAGQDRAVSLQRQRPRHDAGWRGRVRAGGRARGQPSGARHPGGRNGCVGACRRLLSRHRDGRSAGRHSRHDPCPSDPGRRVPGGCSQGARALRCTYSSALWQVSARRGATFPTMHRLRLRRRAGISARRP